MGRSVPLKVKEKSKPGTANKILVKQSYMMLTWMAYINNNTFDLRKIKTRPSFFILPKSRTRFTLIKAPMAHKTFSQEQYLFHSYSMTVRFQSSEAITSKTIPNINQSLAAVLDARRLSYAANETNLISLTRVRMCLSAKEDKYFVFL